MADISLKRSHSFGLDTGKQKLQKLVAKFQASRPEMIDKIEWNPGQTGASATGKMFAAQFQVTDAGLSVDVELKGFVAKMAKGVVQAQLEKTVAEEFPS